jgi:hypothetical protein
MCLFVFVGGAVLAKGVWISMMKFYGNIVVGLCSGCGVWRPSHHVVFQRNPSQWRQVWDRAMMLLENTCNFDIFRNLLPRLA